MRRDASQYGLELQGVLDGDGLEETVLGGGRREKGEPARRPKSPRPDRIDSPDTGSVAEDRLKDEAQGEALLRQAFVFGRSNVAARSWAPSWRR